MERTEVILPRTSTDALVWFDADLRSTVSGTSPAQEDNSSEFEGDLQGERSLEKKQISSYEIFSRRFS